MVKSNFENNIHKPQTPFYIIPISVFKNKMLNEFIFSKSKNIYLSDSMICPAYENIHVTKIFI